MKKRLSLLLAVAALGVGATSPAAYAEPMRVAQEETDDAEDDGSDYGWIGLLGLAGLAGLLGRRRPTYDERDRTRNTGTATTRGTEPRP